MDILYHLYYFLSMYFLSWTKTGMDSHAANLSSMVSEISGQELHRNYKPITFCLSGIGYFTTSGRNRLILFPSTCSDPEMYN